MSYVHHIKSHQILLASTMVVRYWEKEQFKQFKDILAVITPDVAQLIKLLSGKRFISSSSICDRSCFHPMHCVVALQLQSWR